MEPRIQYARTSDGVSIAWTEAGEGSPLLVMSAPAFSHAELSWKLYPPMLGLATRFRAVWYDPRGTGLSDRSAIDFSVEAMLRDAEAVIAAAGLDTFALVTWINAAPTAVTYDVSHPERVTHLVLCDPIVAFPELAASSAYRALVSLLETDWEIYTETFGRVVWAQTDHEFGRRFAEFMRVCADEEAHRALWKAMEDYDVTALLPEIKAPTLVIQNRSSRLLPMRIGQGVAAAIPGARLAVIEDVTYGPVADLVEEFVSGKTAVARTMKDLASGTAIIVFADIADSTGLTERLGDLAFRARARDLDGALRTVIRDHGGTPIDGKLLGDGILAVFTSAREGIAAALMCAVAGGQAGLPLHLGLHAGDVIREDNNVYGGAVNIASRISGLSGPGEVLVSETVRSLARTSAGVRFEDRGEQALKGVGEAVRVWAVSAQEQEPGNKEPG